MGFFGIGFKTDVKHVDSLSGSLYNNYADKTGDGAYISLFYDINRRRFIPIPRDKNSTTFIQEVVEKDINDPLFFERAKKIIPVFITFNNNKEVKRVVTGYSDSLTHLKHLEHEERDVKEAHQRALLMVHEKSDFRLSKDFTEKCV